MTTVLKAVLWTLVGPISVLLGRAVTGSLVNLAGLALTFTAIAGPVCALWFAKVHLAGRIRLLFVGLNLAWYALFWLSVLRPGSTTDKIYTIPLH